MTGFPIVAAQSWSVLSGGARPPVTSLITGLRRVVSNWYTVGPLGFVVAPSRLPPRGGLLVIGVNDDGQPLGLDRDLATFTKQDIDVWEQALVNVLSSYLGTDVASKVGIHLTKVGPNGHDVALVDCQPSSKPVFLSDGANKEFHIRFGNTTRLLDIQEATMYIAEHWKGNV